MRTGIFFYHQKGERLRDFPQALKGILEKENLFFYDAFYPGKPPSSFEVEPISSETLYQVHSHELVEDVKKTGNFEGALFSAAGTVRAAEKIWMGEIDNAFVFTGCGDHHAGTDFFGGGCYFNGAAIGIHVLRRKFGAKRFAIIDTDAHHGAGTWEIFEADPDVLYVCFCGNPNWDENNKVDIHVPIGVTDEVYLEMMRGTLFTRLRIFQPEVLFWSGWNLAGKIYHCSVRRESKRSGYILDPENYQNIGDGIKMEPIYSRRFASEYARRWYLTFLIKDIGSSLSTEDVEYLSN